jgi:phosphohistidine phosphatase
MKRVYFLRHGKAASRSGWEGDDGLRPLTEAGEAAMWREAESLKRLGVVPDLIVTSPLVRARRTAEIVALTLDMADRLTEDERLAHGFDASALASIAAAHEGCDQLMVVGHEPGLSMVVAGLIGGGDLVLRKGGLARVDLLDGSLKRGALAWLLAPALLDRE